jgi:hypothetical protein
MEKFMAAVDELISARVMSPDDFAEGLLAALAATNQTVIAVNQNQLHRAFRRVLAEAQKPESLGVDSHDVDYDPLYQLSGWLDKFLARAQRDLLISSPNPSYGRIVVNLTPDEGQIILSEHGNEETFRNLAAMFLQELGA